MPTVTLDEFMALNEQLAALLAAGVPIDVGLASAGRDTPAALARINAAVARRVRQGATLAEALEGDEHAVPVSYRSLVQVGLQSGNLTAALNGYTRVAQAIDGSWHAIRLGLLYPLVVCGLAYAGLIGLCMFFVPNLENLYQLLQLRPGIGLITLAWLRSTMPYWIAVPPAALLLLALWQLRARSLRKTSGVATLDAMHWLPGMSHAIHMQRCAIFAETLAALLAGDSSLADGLVLAAGASGDSGLAAGAKELAASHKQGQMLADDSPTAQRFPPFLRWALWHSEATTGRVRALGMAAGIYYDAAQRRAEQLRYAIPLAACVVLGGSVTLLYCLALFVPVVEMLRQLA
jgi:type II secretory pathway component PulF